MLVLQSPDATWHVECIQGATPSLDVQPCYPDPVKSANLHLSKILNITLSTALDIIFSPT